jgi:hypothetical protein
VYIKIKVRNRTKWYRLSTGIAFLKPPPHSSITHFLTGGGIRISEVSLEE